MVQLGVKHRKNIIRMRTWFKHSLLILVMLIVTAFVMGKLISLADEPAEMPASVHVVDSDEPLEVGVDFNDQALLNDAIPNLSSLFPPLVILIAFLYISPFPRRLLRPPLTH